MMEKKQIKSSTLSVIKADVTATEIDAFVFYARNDLKLGSGFGNAIALRGGPSIRKELENLGPLKVTEVVVTTAGNMKAKHIIHACGPKFQEENLEQKLKTTIINVLKAAEANGIESIAFPPMGAGFYGVPIDVSAKITIETIAEYLNKGSEIKDVIICANDTREYKALEPKLKDALKKAA
ncbi:MAG: macro domain-containing protein [Nitrospirae bacterium]|nr:macro domain-containing protein [Nitrospirota bacterium]